ncbi:2-hydroxychromene-2-carboxylate isomerase [Micromonospora sp. NPDC003816]|uniref:2-hydroxychromene-2-carboxylate isomerase n=1 Tax=Micromonospora sp. NPDC003816 TaxID=3364224 RepID=UPI0036C7DF15
MKKRPRLYFSFRSPYSWLAVHRLRAEVPDLFAQVDWFPYWDPDEKTNAALAERGAEMHYVQMSRAKHRYLLVDTKRLAQRAGLPMAWPIDVDPWWDLPHLAWLLARRAGRAVPFYDALVAARWERGEDICTPEVVARAAVEAGIDPVAAQNAPQDETLRAEGVDCLAAAYDDDIFGIPYLRVGRHRFWGLDRVDHFLAEWRPENTPTPEASPAVPTAVRDGAAVPAAVLDGAAFDTDTAGGCG